MKKGFTLIELLVVVAIIAVIATVVILNLGGSQRDARDSRRKSDLGGIQTALEVYFSEKGRYPRSATRVCSAPSYSTTWIKDSADSTSLSPNYMAVVPKDPINSTTFKYCYITDANGTAYKLMTKFEGRATADYALDGGNDATVYEVFNGPNASSLSVGTW